MARTLRTPGEPATSDAGTGEDASTDAVETTGSEQEAAAPAKRGRARTAKAAKPADTETTESSTEPLPESNDGPEPPPQLPNAIDIDPKKIRGPVLTNQGWVCPDESGRAAPDALRA